MRRKSIAMALAAGMLVPGWQAHKRRWICGTPTRYALTGLALARIGVRPSNGLGGFIHSSRKNPRCITLGDYQEPIMDNDVTTTAQGGDTSNH